MGRTLPGDIRVAHATVDKDAYQFAGHRSLRLLNWLEERRVNGESAVLATSGTMAATGSGCIPQSHDLNLPQQELLRIRTNNVVSPSGGTLRRIEAAMFSVSIGSN